MNHDRPDEPLSAPYGTYWVQPGRFLAGWIPSDPEPAVREEKLRGLLDVGVRVVVNLMEADERNRQGKPFADYSADLERLARAREATVRCLRCPIRDQDVPTLEAMDEILDHLDRALRRDPVYLHCWGGVGRTGTVVACWLLRHGRADETNYLKELAKLRRMDQRAGDRKSPENDRQLRFVQEWAARR
ncbi:MAG: protein phosphatase [Armatimonadetes bacterium]|nr:protein phosphatase [Armatimonadota bacterium]